MYNIFGLRVPDYSYLAIKKASFNLIDVSIGKVHCCYFDQQGGLNRHLGSDIKIYGVKGNAGKIHVELEGELYKYIINTMQGHQQK